MRAAAVLLLSACSSVLAQATPPPSPCDSRIISQARAAIEALASSAQHLGAKTQRLITAEYEGSAAIESHLFKPGDTRVVPVRLRFVCRTDGSACRIEEISGQDADARTETTVVLNERVCEQPSWQAPFKEMAPASAPTKAFEYAQWLPWTLLHRAAGVAPTCRIGPPISAPAAPAESPLEYLPVTFTDPSGTVCTALFNPDKTPARIESLAAHQRLGDVCQWTEFGSWRSVDGVPVPGRITRQFVGPSTTSRYELELRTAAARAPGPDDFHLPSKNEADVPTWGDGPRAASTLTKTLLAPDVWTVEVPDANARVAVIERAHDLVLLGAPDGDAVCAGLLAYLHQSFAPKRVGLCAISHHHPSPSGGLRAVAASGAKLLIPRALDPYVRGLLSRPVTLGTPTVAGPDQPVIDLFESETTIDAGDASVRLIDIAEKSAHTFCFVVFYFPKHGVLIEDDLGYFPLEGATRAGPRLLGLTDALEQRRITPTRLVQAWPLRGVHPEVDWATVAGLVSAERAKTDAR